MSLTPQQINDFGVRLKSDYPTNQSAVSLGNGLVNLASTLTPEQPPTQPPAALDPRIRFRDFTLQQFFGISSLTQQSGGIWRPDVIGNPNGAINYYPYTRFDATGVVTEAYVVAIEFIAPTAGYRGYFDRNNLGQTAPAEISATKGVFTSACRTGSISWSTVPNEPVASYTKLLPGQRYWLQIINVKRDALIQGRLEATTTPPPVSTTQYGVAAWQNKILLRPSVLNRIVNAFKGTRGDG